MSSTTMVVLVDIFIKSGIILAEENRGIFIISLLDNVFQYLVAYLLEIIFLYTIIQKGGVLWKKNS